MNARQAEIDGVLVITPKLFRDERGYFCETFRHDDFRKLCPDITFIQDNQARSTRRHVVRGLHYQEPPFAQAKLIRVLRGRILDVALDLRRSSPTFGRHVAIELDGERMEQVFVPEGFAHGYLTLEPDVEIAYKVSAPYSPAHERGVRWNDPALGVPWPIGAGEAILSAKDARLPLFDAIDSPFVWSGGRATAERLPA